MTKRVSANEAIGMKFNRLTVAALWRRSKNYTAIFNCRCECGGTTHATLQDLRNGRTVSCGCYRKERIGGLNRRHSKSGTKIYNTYRRMIARCYDSAGEQYARYGGRGIKVCERWRVAFDNFFKDMGEPPSQKHSIDRINTHGDYEPTNCRWALPIVQVRNRTNTKRCELNGVTSPLGEWCDKFSVPYRRVALRMRRGWTLADALTRPAREPGYCHRGHKMAGDVLNGSG